MAMTIGYSCKATVLFKVFKSEECVELFAFLVISFLFSLLFEFILSLKQKYYKMYKERSVDESLVLKEKLILSLFYTIAVILSAMHMFFLMSSNIWIILSIIFGNLFGYFLFGLNISKNKQISLLA